MAGRTRLVLVSLVIAVMLLALTGLAGASDGDDAPCPDFFFQEPLPINDWPVIEAADSNTAWAVSLGSLIVKTENGGANWEYQWSDLQRDPDPPPLRDICAVNSDVVWICGDGGAVLVTVDGGENWSVKRIAVPEQYYMLNGISALDDKVAWVAGVNGNVYTTSDGGDNWISCPVPGVAGEIYDVSALSDKKAWISGEDDVVAVTDDKGTSWDRKDPAVGPVTDMRKIKAFSGQDVYTVGNEGGFYTTDDGGGTWNYTDVGNDLFLFDMSFTDAQKGWISGTDDYSAGYMAVTADGGQNWMRVSTSELGSERNVTAISTRGSGTIWSCTVDGALLRSSDNGNRWVRMDSTATRESVTGVCAIDDRAAWVVGSNGLVMRTHNGGRTWEHQTSGVSEGLGRIDAADSSTAWAIGDGGTIIHTDDYGRNWVGQSSGAGDAQLSSISVVDSKEAWVSGVTQIHGVLLHTTDGGNNWEKEKEMPGVPVLAVSSLGEERVWFATLESKQGYVYRSTDGGSTWNKSRLPRPVAYQEIINVIDTYPVSEELCLALVQTAYGTDNFTYLYRSIDGGKNWHVVGDYIITGNNLFGLVTDDGEDIWTCGAMTSPYLEPTTTFHTADWGRNWENGKDFYRTVLFDIDSAGGDAMWTVGYISTILRSTCPSLYSLSPDSAPNTGVVEITDMAGSMFWDGMEVWLENDGTRIDATEVDVESPFEATCEFDLDAVPVGAYDVMTRNASGLESTLEEGFTVTSPTTWYLPEGSTGADGRGAFETWVLVENPNEAETRVDVTYMTPNGEIAGPQFTMPAESRQTVNVADTVSNEYSVSTKVEADAPIVAERAMYWNAGDTYRQCSHGSIGLSTLSKDWYMAEGSTGSDERGGFETWVLVQNPGDAQAEVSVTYMTPEGHVEGPDMVLPPGSRRTVNVADTVPSEWSVSTFLKSDVPVAAERSTYWSSGDTFRQAATDSIAASGPAREWYLAEGSTGSDASGNLETWILLENPYEHSVRANLDYQTAWGLVEGPEVVVEPFTRETVNVADTVPGEFNVSTHVAADGPIIAERAMYWNAADTYRQAAHGSIGVMSPRREWMVAEGSTGADHRGSFESWILVQNPGDSPADVRLTYMTPAGPVEGPEFELPPDSRRSVSIADTLPDTWSVSTRVVSDRPVVVDRSVYWSAATQSWRSAHNSKGYGSN